MTNLELEALRRQVEEDYKLDIAAIERLQRRLGGGGAKGGIAAVERQSTTESNVVPLPPQAEGRGQAPQDDLTESLRSMFSSYRK